MPEVTNKKSSKATVAAVIVIAVAVIALAAYLVYILSPKKAAPENESPAPAPDFSVEESSEPEEISVELKNTLAEAEIGDLVHYGSYIQAPGFNADGPATPIEWIVLDKRDGKFLLLSYRALEIWKYDDDRESGITAFEESSLFRLLNKNFYNGAFTESEREFIAGDEGSKVFILSAEEAGKYLTPESHRIAHATHTAASHHGKDDADAIEWWLADVTSQGFAAYVFTDGSIRLKGYAFDYSEVGVRPAIWVDSAAEAE